MHVTKGGMNRAIQQLWVWIFGMLAAVMDAQSSYFIFDTVCFAEWHRFHGGQLDYEPKEDNFS